MEKNKKERNQIEISSLKRACIAERKNFAINILENIFSFGVFLLFDIFIGIAVFAVLAIIFTGGKVSGVTYILFLGSGYAFIDIIAFVKTVIVEYEGGDKNA